MRNFFILLFCLIIGETKAQTLYTISGTITQTASYCQGAAPSEEMLNKLNTPTPLPNKTIYIKRIRNSKYKAKILAKFTTDSLGKFEIKLPRGSYCFIEAYKVKPFRIKKSDKVFKYDNKCLRKLHNQCDLSLVVTSNKNDISINYHSYCDWGAPCVQYLGELVP